MSSHRAAMRIRNFQPGDEAALWTVFFSSVHELTGAHYSADQREAWAPHAQDQTAWALRLRMLRPFIAETTEGIAGYADLQANGHIDHFFIAPAFARQCIGSALMAHIHAQAAHRGLRELLADVSLAAEAFFARHGFVVQTRQCVALRGQVLRNARMRKHLLP